MDSSEAKLWCTFLKWLNSNNASYRSVYGIMVTRLYFESLFHFFFFFFCFFLLLFLFVHTIRNKTGNKIANRQTKRVQSALNTEMRWQDRDEHFVGQRACARVSLFPSYFPLWDTVTNATKSFSQCCIFPLFQSYHLVSWSLSVRT